MITYTGKQALQNFVKRTGQYAMNIPHGDPRLSKTVTNVGLITSNGSFGHNIMACEWTYFISYSPALIALGIGSHKASAQNIRETKEFGVSMCAEDQNVIASVAGNHSGAQTDKIGLLKELGFEFHQAEHMDLLMVSGACMSAECKLLEIVELGDHPLLIGEVKHVVINDKQPLAYFQGGFHQIGSEIQKPTQERRDEMRELAKQFVK
jgi:flavin reductase (DIM6/NTAB) family NADH-FMN oxidoreductase RutF